MIQTYDIVMLVVLVGATLFGVWKGMAWQVASLASVLVSAAVAVHSSAAIAPYFPGQEPWNRFLAMLVLYVITAGAIWILFRLVSNIIDRVKLKEFDRQLGAIFGLAKGDLVLHRHHVFCRDVDSEPTRQMVLQSRSGRSDCPGHPQRQSASCRKTFASIWASTSTSWTQSCTLLHRQPLRRRRNRTRNRSPPAGGPQGDAQGLRRRCPGRGQGGGGEARKTAAGKIAVRSTDLQAEAPAQAAVHARAGSRGAVSSAWSGVAARRGGCQLAAFSKRSVARQRAGRRVAAVFSSGICRSSTEHKKHYRTLQGRVSRLHRSAIRLRPKRTVSANWPTSLGRDKRTSVPATDRANGVRRSRERGTSRSY